jgi:hypothetical protein
MKKITYEELLTNNKATRLDGFKDKHETKSRFKLTFFEL